MPPYAYLKKYKRDTSTDEDSDSSSSTEEDLNRPDMFYAVNQTFAYFGWKMDIATVYRNDHSSNKRDDLNLATIWSFVHDWKLVVETGVEAYQVGLPHVIEKNLTERLGPLDEQNLAFSTWTRVLVVGLQPEFLRQFLYTVFVEKKFNIEEYVIMYLDNNYMIGGNIENQPWRDPNLSENHPVNQKLKTIFRHVLIFRQENLFAGDVARYESLRDEFAAACKASTFANCSLPEKPAHLQYVAATHDGIKLLMEAMNQSVTKDLKNGSELNMYGQLFPYVKKKTFHDPKFATNANVTFNAFGQRVGRMNVLRMEDLNSGNFTVHITYNVDGSNTTTGTTNTTTSFTHHTLHNPPI